MLNPLSRTLRTRRRSDLRAPDVVGELFMLLMVAVIVVGAATGSLLTVTLGTTAFAVTAGGLLWSKLSLEEVEYGSELSDQRVFPGDELTLTLTVENRKPLPVPWLQVTEFVPSGLQPASDRGITRRAYAGGSEIVETISLSGYERVKFRHVVEAKHRGYYALGPTDMRSGDLFGLFGSVRRDQRSANGVTVYPHVVPLDDWPLPAANPMGDILNPYALVDDQSRPRSTREYVPGDPLKRVDWKVSAKRDNLTVRTFDRSVSNDVVILHEATTTAVAWQGCKYDVLEASICGAASIAVRFVQAGFRVGFIGNGVRTGRGIAPTIAPSESAFQSQAILEALAMVQPWAFRRLELMSRERTGHVITSGAALVLVTGMLSDSLREYLESVSGQGHRVTVAWVGREDPPVLDRADVRDMRGRFDVLDSEEAESAAESRDQDAQWSRDAADV